MQGSGDQKFTYGVDGAVLQKLADRSPVLAGLYETMSKSMNATPPFSLGYPSESTQSSDYPGNDIDESDAALVSKILSQNAIFPENTRLCKTRDGTSLEVLVA